eukprot:GILI01009692.1.p1 GENE.GILI01009692.1~~GILI01009692.1.p1  ORF type:complete len:390 (+),score=107.45 GILI01009692.1:125-1171(+)
MTFPPEMNDQGNCSMFALYRRALVNHIRNLRDMREKESLESMMEAVVSDFRRLSFVKARTEHDERVNFYNQLSLCMLPVPATRLIIDTQEWRPVQYYCNPAFCKMAGLKENGITVCLRQKSEYVLIINPVDALRQARTFIESVRAGKSSYQFQGRFTLYAGEFELNEHCNIDYNSQGTPQTVTSYYTLIRIVSLNTNADCSLRRALEEGKAREGKPRLEDLPDDFRQVAINRQKAMTALAATPSSDGSPGGFLAGVAAVLGVPPIPSSSSPLSASSGLTIEALSESGESPVVTAPVPPAPAAPAFSALIPLGQSYAHMHPVDAYFAAAAAYNRSSPLSHSSSNASSPS